MMSQDKSVLDFINAKKINSFQKLHFLLLLHQNPHLKANKQQFAERLYIGDMYLLAEIVNDLEGVGLLKYAGGQYSLADSPEIRKDLQSLAAAFEDPFERQEILDLIIQKTPFHLDHKTGYQIHWQYV